MAPLAIIHDLHVGTYKDSGLRGYETSEIRF